MRLLAPALKAVSKRPIALINPTQVPYAQGFGYSGVPANKLLLLTGKASADLLWSAEQVLRAGTCGAVILWQQHIRAEAVKRHKVDREIDVKSSHRQIRERAILKNRFLSTRCRIIDVKSSHLARRLTPSMATFEAILPILLS
jgi:hypothetical protein